LVVEEAAEAYLGATGETGEVKPEEAAEAVVGDQPWRKKRTLATVYVQGASSLKCRYTGGSAAAGSRAGAPMEGPTGGQAALERWSRFGHSLLDEHARWKCVSQAEGQSKACTVVWRGGIPALATWWHLERTMRAHTSDLRRSGSLPAWSAAVWKAWWVGSRQAVGQSRWYNV
jgi:hypothetical protein